MKSSPIEEQDKPNILDLYEHIWPVMNQTGKDITLYTYNQNPNKVKPYIIRPGERIIFPKQVQFLRAMDKYDAILYGGAVGAGKSVVLRWALIWQLVRWAMPPEEGGLGLKGVEVGLFCETYKALEDRHIGKLKAIHPAIGRYVDASKEFRLNPRFGGGIIKLRNLDDYSKYASAEFAAIAVDELTFNPKAVFDFLKTRRRWPPIEHCPIIAATNPGQIGHCIPEGNVLTPDKGWVDIRTMKVGDAVYTVLSDGSLKESVVDQFHEYDYSGPMIDVDAENLQMLCTPNHKVAKRGGLRHGKNTRDKKSDLFSLVPFEELPGQAYIMRAVQYDAPDLPDFVLEKSPGVTKHDQPMRMTGMQFCELLGWFLSEGHTVERDHAFTISQMKPENRVRIKSLLDEIGFTYSTGETGFTVYSRTWYEYLRQFGKCRDKFIPQWVKNGSLDNIRTILFSLMLGDGHWSGPNITGGHYYTTSAQLANDVAELAAKVGAIVRITSRQRDNREGLSYDVSFHWRKNGFTELLTGHHKYGVETSTKRKSKITRDHFDGKVYCIGVPDTHTFLVQQRGSVWVSGNSWVLHDFVDPTSRVQPYYDEEEDYQSKGYHFIQALPKDNPLLSKQYRSDMKKWPEKIRRALVMGDWTVYAGQYFNLDPNIHWVPDFEIPATWNRIRVIDHGGAHPTVCLWMAADPEGNTYVYREYSRTGSYAEAHKKQIVRMSAGETYRISVADPSMWKDDFSSANNKFPAEIYNDQNDGVGSLFLSKANNARVAGWQALQNAFGYELEGERQLYDLDEAGRPKIKFKRQPKLYIFRSCECTWRSVTNIIHDDVKNVEDVKKTKGYYEPGQGDDEAECVRYGYLAINPSAVPDQIRRKKESDSRFNYRDTRKRATSYAKF